MIAKLKFVATVKRLPSLVALGLVLLSAGPGQALVVELLPQPQHPPHDWPYLVIDDPASSRPPEQLIFPFYLYICDFRGERPGFSLAVDVDSDYDISVGPGGKDKEADVGVFLDEEGMRILQAYWAIWLDRWEHPSARDGETDIILKNWDDCVDCLEAFARHYAAASPYVFYAGYTFTRHNSRWSRNVELIELEAPWKDYDAANRPPGVLKIPVSELRDFLTGRGKWSGKWPDQAEKGPAGGQLKPGQAPTPAPIE